MGIGRLVGGIAKKTAIGAGRASQTRPGMFAVMGGAAALGMATQVAPAARDAAMDVAFGDPNADTAFLGRKLTPGAMFDAIVPGDSSGTATVAMAAGLGTVGVAGGGLIGGAVGAGKYKMTRAAARSDRISRTIRAGADAAGDLNPLLQVSPFEGRAYSTLVAPTSRRMHMASGLRYTRAPIGSVGAGAASTVRGAVKGAASLSRGTIIGAAVGAIAGLGIAAGLGSAYINRNEKFFRESPYVGNRRLGRDMSYGGNLYSNRNTSLQTAQELNADGNIVLGMHNLRRGG